MKGDHTASITGLPAVLTLPPPTCNSSSTSHVRLIHTSLQGISNETLAPCPLMGLPTYWAVEIQEQNDH